MLDIDSQYARVCTLIVGDKNGDAIDLSNLRIKFATKHSESMTPNTLDCRVYNLEADTAIKIAKQFKTVILQAGYEGNFGVIFKGNIKQVLIGRESAVDTFIDIIAGDGDRAYNYSIINDSLAAGAKQSDQINKAIEAMSQKGVKKGFISETPGEGLARGKVLYGRAREVLKSAADNSNASFSIQDESIVILNNRSYLPGEAVILTSKTGMIGTPVQTVPGVNVKCLLNPRLKYGGRIQIDNASVQRVKINLDIKDAKGIAANTAPPLDADGYYYIAVVEHTGDTRGNDWYSTLVTLLANPTLSPGNSVQTNYGEAGT